MKKFFTKVNNSSRIALVIACLLFALVTVLLTTPLWAQTTPAPLPKPVGAIKICEQHCAITSIDVPSAAKFAYGDGVSKYCAVITLPAGVTASNPFDVNYTDIDTLCGTLANVMHGVPTEIDAVSATVAYNVCWTNFDPNPITGCVNVPAVLPQAATPVFQSNQSSVTFTPVSPTLVQIGLDWWTFVPGITANHVVLNCQLPVVSATN